MSSTPEPRPNAGAAMRVTIPDFCLVVLAGAAKSGKSTFARTHFTPAEVLSSDADLIRKRLAARRLTVVDAANLNPEDRRQLVAIAREYHAMPVALAFDIPASICQERAGRAVGRRVIRNQCQLLRDALRHPLRREGFLSEYRFRSPQEADAVVVERRRLRTDRREDRGPFDIIGDLHGCFDEAIALLGRLGYVVERGEQAAGGRFRVSHPDGRRLIFLGDLVDRGPNSTDCLRLAIDAVAAGAALCVPGNHDDKLGRKLRGRNVQVNRVLARTLEQLAAEPPEWSARVAEFIDSLPAHYELDGGRLVVAHAGMKEAMQGRDSRTVRDFALYGETTGETDQFGLPVRHEWAAEYRGAAQVVYGHTPVPAAEWLNRTICLDTGCVFGGRLTALRYPENELVSVQAERVYTEPGGRRVAGAGGAPPPLPPVGTRPAG